MARVKDLIVNPKRGQEKKLTVVNSTSASSLADANVALHVVVE